ncbi:hypothetical protein [Canibacter oris]|uniref:Uncharacterized protein n=1 Tax=Canibacter oris TaxID=1365628 RepID=A0A840DNK2_9MICO|nr:hypothetical protein [Canibacter oris]MBB4071618.1 hypothetical protein [Canibacter oris]
MDKFNSESPMFSADSNFNFIEKWLDHMYNEHIIDRQAAETTLDILRNDLLAGIIVTASYAIEHTKKTGQLMPAWITDTYRELYNADSWLLDKDYNEYMQVQEEAKKALAAA